MKTRTAMKRNALLALALIAALGAPALALFVAPQIDLRAPATPAADIAPPPTPISADAAPSIPSAPLTDAEIDALYDMLLDELYARTDLDGDLLWMMIEEVLKQTNALRQLNR